MAGSNVRVSVEALATAINDYNGKKASFQQAYLQISNVVRQLSVNYKSDAANAFYAKFDEIYKNISQTETQMESAITKLTQVKEIYEELIALQKAAVNALETDFAATGNIFG
jgi:WXG100 family type VII secretion target